ncbi:hypothetical protein GWI33_015295 [Rhynchophorus ferrugineus]|uniref:Uncharacterized protein n=1 Tax=Rhynchophorus ferrugineus TaxID=354439 RepID=A0A834M885_RHYFE|nr:hypothetical protein GWI33_015295 [Rhynchophorus ferrugineus]
MAPLTPTATIYRGNMRCRPCWCSSRRYDVTSHCGTCQCHLPFPVIELFSVTIGKKLGVQMIDAEKDPCSSPSTSNLTSLVVKKRSGIGDCVELDERDIT